MAAATIVTLLLTFSTLSFLTECVSGYIETVVGVAGRRVTLPCRATSVKESETEVCWGRGEPSLFTCHNTILSTDGTRVTHRSSIRYRLDSGLRSGEVSLSIHSSRETDAGFYHCRVLVPGLFNDQISTIHLIVMPAPMVYTVAATANPQPVKRTTQLKHVTYRFRPKSVLRHLKYTTESPRTTPKTTVLEKTTASEVTADTEYSIIRPRAVRVRSYEEPVFYLRSQFESLQNYVGNTVRLSAIIFIPGLLLAVFHRLRTRKPGYPSSFQNYSVPEETSL